MASLIEELIVVLEEEKECYIQLLSIGQSKTDIIIKGDVSSLSEITKYEQETATHVVKLEKKREEIINDIALVTNKDSKELTITNLALLLTKQQEQHDELIKLRDDIKDIVEKLRDINDKNKILLQESLDYIDFTMNAIQSTNSVPNSNYESKGNFNDATINNSLFDAKQ